MTVIDLTHPVAPGMPVYPGTVPPSVERANTLERDGFLEHRIGMHTHTGTHMDAPAHILPGGATLDSYPAERFMGPAFMIEALDGPPAIASLRAHEDEIRKSDFLIMRTGWGGKVGLRRVFQRLSGSRCRRGGLAVRDETQGFRRGRHIGGPGRGFLASGASCPARKRHPHHREPGESRHAHVTETGLRVPSAPYLGGRRRARARRGDSMKGPADR